MMTTNKQRIEQVYECVKTFHSLEELPQGLPDPQNINLLPTLRPYQVRAVQWMLYKELHPSYYTRSSGCTSTSESAVRLPKGGILADEMGLGKTVEMLACILSNPRTEDRGSTTQIKEEVEVPTKNTDGGMDFEPLPVIHSGDEFNPTEDGIVEIKNDNVKPNDDFKYGLEDMDDSGCVQDYTSSESNKPDVETEMENLVGKRKITKHDIHGASVVTPKRKKRKIDDDDVQTSAADTTVKSKPKPGENYLMLKSWYDDCLTETSVRSERTKRFKKKSTFQCCCFDNVMSDNTVQCPECQTWQHVECVGYDEMSADYEYCCFQCWQHKPPVWSAGTVIISPESISQQWVSEIQKHVKKDNLKLLVYEGVRVNGYIQPHDLANYDIIITTYQVLTKELNYTEPVKRTLRHAKRYFAPTSPLLFVQWWRLCLDEAQMVEGSTCRAAEMAKKFTAINKWAVTGTPIQKAVNDLVGLMEFLAGNEYPEFLALMSKDWLSLLLLVPRVLWRTQKKDVLAETGVPPQTENTHLLDFSKIETYFYQCTHTECSQQFLGRIAKFPDLNVSLKSIDRKLMNSLLNPLLKLRQACLHPQAVRGKFMSVKKTMTMEDLVSQMVTKAKLDAEQALRQLVSCLNGIGALRIILQEWPDAVEAYRAVLHIEQEYSPRLKIDSLQRIHTMHNLVEVLDGDYEGVPPTLRDGTLRDDIKALELRYLGKRKAPIKSTEERVDEHAVAIEAKLEGATLSYSNWWEKLLQWNGGLERNELLDKLKAAIQLTDAQQKNQYNNLANKLKSLYIVRVEIAQWLAEMDKTREEVQAWLRKLRRADKDDMAADALNCHLPQAFHRKGRIRCKICKAESSLKHYESLLFEARSKEKRKSKKGNLPGSSDWKDDKDMDNKEIAELVDVNVNTFESSKKGGFKASPFEKILQALVMYGRQRQAPSNWTKEGTDHLNLIQRVKKEFLDLNLLWRQIFDLVDARDELNMCKTRLRLPFLGEEEEQESKKKKIGENLHIIPLYRVEPELRKLEEEKKQHEVLLKKKTGTLCYLETLKKDGAQVPICPICRNDLTDKWAVMECGHCICLECLSLVCKTTQIFLLCPQCRQQCDMPNISYVESQPSQLQPVEVNGSHSSKVHAVLAQTLRLTAEQPDVKILVFSQWERVLDLLAEAFGENSITFRRLKSGKLKQREDMKDFKKGNVTVLLLPLRSGAKGLNLIEATHVFLVEPILNPAEELQAVGRVHRIGQTKPTVVHRFIVRDTIEERILASVAESGADQWSDDCVTLRQLFDLFTPSSDLEQPLSQEPGPSSVVIDSDNDSDSDDDNNQTLREFIDNTESESEEG